MSRCEGSGVLGGVGGVQRTYGGGRRRCFGRSGDGHVRAGVEGERRDDLAKRETLRTPALTRSQHARQALLTGGMGKKRIIAETGRAAWGGEATAAAHSGWRAMCTWARRMCGGSG